MKGHVVGLMLLCAGCCKGSSSSFQPVANPSPPTTVPGSPPANSGLQKGDTFRNEQHLRRYAGTVEAFTGSHYYALFPTKDHLDKDDRRANLEISVQKGQLRGYLSNGKSYYFVEASPGKPARTSGEMVHIGNYYGFTLEAPNGTAEGVSYRFWR